MVEQAPNRSDHVIAMSSGELKSAEFQLRAVSDPRLALHATSALPAWLWSLDGTRILWSNPVGAKPFGAANVAVLLKKTFGPADAHRGQVAQQRLGSGADIGLVALIAPGASLTADCKSIEGEAPAELVLVDEFAEVSEEPAPEIEAVADERSTSHAEPSPSSDEPEPNARRHPLRFMWQMDAEARFSIDSDEFNSLIGPRTAAGFGRLWSEIAEAFALDPDGRVLSAVATRDTWSGITLNWPSDGDGRLPVELSGLPIFDQMGNFAGYRGFGVCRDLEGLTRLAALRRAPTAELPGETISNTPVSTIASDTSPPTDLEKPVDTPKNVVL